jgi:hypothetical protein
MMLASTTIEVTFSMKNRPTSLTRISETRPIQTFNLTDLQQYTREENYSANAAKIFTCSTWVETMYTTLLSTFFHVSVSRFTLEWFREFPCSAVFDIRVRPAAVA